MHLDATATRHGDVTLVELHVVNDGPDERRVRVENRLDGPVWHPRRSGRAANGWDDAGYEGTVDAGARLALGYACPAPATDPPAALVAPEGDADPGAPTAGDVLADLGDPRPPRDAVDVGATDDGPETETADPVPEAVSAWLDGDEGRLPSPTASERKTRRRDRAALAAVAERVATLRRRGER
jgi:hypothetical protein